MVLLLVGKNEQERIAVGQSKILVQIADKRSRSHFILFLGSIYLVLEEMMI
ncbi:hypothetical protein Ccrd_020886 [Cynara cardunculus var. scolymus]|uniref:Uncharacterized protein n=1 Tax=Cynara cardunculus var. scolymus TaxID=59895 RepID=A0A118K072_CYNCS|nr:hypothetical protein Ccrd_020886 [Cynara cardunculus var. scolymus]